MNENNGANLEKRTAEEAVRIKAQKPAHIKELKQQEQAQEYCDKVYRAMGGPYSSYASRFWGG